MHILTDSAPVYIQFTIEEDKGEQVAFLDVLLTPQEDRMSTSVYWEPMHTDQYFSVNSHQSPQDLTDNTMHEGQGSPCVCDDALRHQELKHLEKMFLANGFP